MGEAKRRKLTTPDYGEESFKKSLLTYLNERLPYLAGNKESGLHIMIYGCIATEERYNTACIVFRGWFLENKIEKDFAFLIGKGLNNSVLVGCKIEDFAMKGAKLKAVDFFRMLQQSK